MNTKMKMKIAAMTACAMIAVGASIKPVYAGGRMDIHGTKEEQLNFWEAITKETKEEKFIVKYVGSDFDEKTNLQCAKPNFGDKGENEQWRNADEAGRKRLMEQAKKIQDDFKKKYDGIGVMRSGLITKSYFYTFAPKGTVKVGDQIIAKIIPGSENPLHDCPSRQAQYYAAGIERVIKRSESKSDSGSGSGNAFKSSFLN